MKVANFITHTLLFLAAWLGLSIASWEAAQALASSTLMPWILPTITEPKSQAAVAYALGASISLFGSCLVALLFLTVVIAFEAIFHRLRKLWRSGTAKTS